MGSFLQTAFVAFSAFFFPFNRYNTIQIVLAKKPNRIFLCFPFYYLLHCKVFYLVIFQSLFVINATSQSPTISGFAPSSGTVGTSVFITGTNFDPVASNNTVYFGAVKASITAATSTALAVTVPTGTTYEPISVTTNDVTAYSSKPFIVTFPSCGAFTAGSFASKLDFPAGSNPTSSAIGDFDGDGRLDVVVTNTNSNTISIFQNIGSSGNIDFASKFDYGTGSSPVSVAVGDVNGDGKLDLAVANRVSNTVSVFRNISANGTIIFDIKIDYPTGGDAPFDIAMSDLDGDGKTDIAAINNLSNTVSIFHNSGSGGIIAFGQKIDFTTGFRPRSLAIGDLNGDGRPDLVVTHEDRMDASIFRNTGTSGLISFNAKIDVGDPFGRVGPNPSIPLGNVAIGDLDGDGRPDLAFLHVYSSPPAKGLPTTYNSVINILKNIAIDENIAFQIIGGNNIPGSFFEFGYSLASYVSYVAISDLDGDGKPDLAVSKIDSSVSIFKNSSVTGSISFAGKVDFGTGLNTRSIVIGDLNGDSKPDLAFANSFTSTVSALKNERPRIE